MCVHTRTHTSKKKKPLQAEGHSAVSGRAIYIELEALTFASRTFCIPSKDQQACLALSLGDAMVAVFLSGYYLETDIPLSLTEQFI